MDAFALGLMSLPVLLALVLLRAPIGLAMLLVGFGGLWLVSGSPSMALAKLKHDTYSSFSNYNLSIVPLFLLMGQFATLSGLSGRLFAAAGAFFGHLRGGVAMAAVGACAGFGSICGSSLATAATMSRVALPELRAAGASGGFATASLAAGGTLGILIPPSFILVIYAMLTEQNIAKLFVAAMIPGLLAATRYIIAIALYARRHPENAGIGRRAAWSERIVALVRIWPVVLIFGVVVFGIVGDWNWSKPGTQALFTPTEGAAIGAVATGLSALLMGQLSWNLLAEALRETAISTAMIFFIVFGAGFYNGFLALAQVPQELSLWVEAQAFAPMTVLFMILALYLVFGCFMDSLSMILLTVPVFWPLLAGMDFGMSTEHFAIWFGVLVLVVVEVGLITPPVGLNLFIISAIDGETPVSHTYRAVAWFVAADFVRIALLIAFPAITLAFIG